MSQADGSARVDDRRVEELAVEITARAALVRDRIASAVVDRDPEEVTVVAVTKGHAPEVAVAALVAGFAELGESYAQELRDKAPAVAEAARRRGLESPRWHFVGRLQTNKVRLVADVVRCWESLDRASALDAVARRAPGAAVLVQVDLAGLPDRGGCPRREVPDLVALGGELDLDVRGLMGVGPPGPPEGSRDSFRWLRAEADRLGLPEVSMGMSGDLEVAVSEGATLVRVGSDLVGPRPAPN